MRCDGVGTLRLWARKSAEYGLSGHVYEVRKGLAGDVGLKDPGQGQDKPPTDKASKGAYAEGAAQAAAAGDVAKAEWDVFAKTNDMLSAHNAALHEFRLKAAKSFGITGIAMLYCVIQKMFDEALTQGYIQRVTFLMREGNM